MGVNSHPAVPRKVGSSSSAIRARAASRRASRLVAVTSANRALHLQLDEPVHLDGVLHRQLLDDRLDEAVDDELAGLLLADAVGLQVEHLLVADLADGRLVADVDVVLAEADRR